MQPLDQFAAELTRVPPTACHVQSSLTQPPSPHLAHPLPDRFPPWLLAMLGACGITHLAPGQAEALEQLHRGHHVLFTAPNGRGLVRQLAMFQSIGIDRQGHSLWIFPLKHREQAQRQLLLKFNDRLLSDHQLSVATYDGDTPVTERRAIRQTTPDLVFTTPEMLHAGILAYHSGWRTLFQHLRFVVIADLHLYAGALGTHLGHLLRRIDRLARHYGSQPQFLLTSDPLACTTYLAQILTGHACEIVNGEAWQPHDQHRVMMTTTDDLTRAGREIATRLLHARLPSLVLTTAATANSTPEVIDAAERRILKREETILALPPHTPPEMVRPGVFRALVCLGLPPSITALNTWLARLGNGYESSLAILLLTGQTPAERYLLRHPDAYQASSPQALPLTLHNPYVFQQHLLCTTSELALGTGEPYPGIYNLDDHLAYLAKRRQVIHRTEARQWTATERRPHRQLRLRWFERPYMLWNRQDAQRVGRLEAAQAFRMCFEGTTYPTQEHGPFHVERIDDERCRVTMRPAPGAPPTRAQIQTEVSEVRPKASVITPNYRLTFGSLEYREMITAFERLDPKTGRRQSMHILSSRQRLSRTQGIWLHVPHHAPEVQTRMRTALHTVVHAVMAVLPVCLLISPDNIQGGVHALTHDGQANLNAFFVDSHMGGSGASRALYEAGEQVLSAALSLMQQCDCQHGCPQCGIDRCDSCASGIQRDREAGIELLQQVLGVTIVPASQAMLTPLTESGQTPRHLYLNLTTQKASDDVGGWQHKHLLGLGIAVIYDTADASYHVYTEETIDALIAHLQRADLIISFNTRDFDYQILQPYTDVQLPSLSTYAMLDEIQHALGYRLSFKHLLKETLGVERPDDRLDTVAWYRHAQSEAIIAACRRDIDWMRDLIRHISHTGSLRYRDRTGIQHEILLTLPFAERYG
ncbi:Zn-binding domain-containing protein [Candidatus Entotheonella palauensis]|uniref:Zn-binding domain-containing protein n=1 Tax=Candidatus Entotheonella palauensis TaxID=93172 RepID=UPI000B7FE3F6|nr:Zn-binding domain-containing protein [Candidatus Entotheonella palauensis]